MRHAILFTLLAAGCAAQEIDKVTVPFSDPNRPRTLRVDLMHGHIAVRAHSGNDAIVEIAGTAESQKPAVRSDGLRRIHSGGFGATIEERENVIRVSSSFHRQANVTVHVPANTKLILKGHNNTIDVSGIAAEIEANSLNGGIKLNNVSGAVVAHTLNGGIHVLFDRLAADKPMSFSTLNGTIDVTLPADAKARLKLKTQRGEVWSDFDVKLEPNTDAVKVEDERSSKGRYRVQLDRAMIASINGGGPELQFTSMNGSILIRKKK